MPKFAPVCPIHIYEALYEASYHLGGMGDVIGDYFLLLAHDVITNEERYRTFFTRLRQERDITIIMDNSVIELGTSCEVKTLARACDIVNADVLVIPDVLQDASGTYHAAVKFLEDWVKYGYNFAGIDLMYVPQGSYQSEYEACVRSAAKMLGKYITWIGLARNVTDRLYDSRTDALEYASKYFPKAKYHMLGFSENTRDDIDTCIAYPSYIEGIDSAVPLRITETLQDPIQAVGPRCNWWDTAQPTAQMFDNVLAVRRRLGGI